MRAGTHVRFTGRYLRNTGQVVGVEGLGRWIVVACECGLCNTGEFVALNERKYDGEGQRHVNVGNMQIVGQRYFRADEEVS